MGMALPFKIELKELETPGLRGRKSGRHQYLFAFDMDLTALSFVHVAD